MKVQIVGLQRIELKQFIADQFSDLEVVETDPELIISYGGDGTLLYAERHFPGIPKAMLRNSLICDTCAKIAKETIPALLLEGKYTVKEYMMLAGETNGQRMVAMNDVVVGHSGVNGTLRARVFVDGKQYGDELLGDGIVVSSPFGSTGYYQSITRSNFQTGIGLAFNNSVNIINHVSLNEDSIIEIEVTRGPGIFAVDNAEETIALSIGDRVKIQRAEETAKLVRFLAENERFNVDMNTNRMPLGVCQICRQHYGK